MDLICEQLNRHFPKLCLNLNARPLVDLPQPPPALRHLHDLVFVSATWQHVEAMLKQPTSEVLMGAGARAVQVLGAAVFVVGRSGQLHAFSREVPQNFVRLDSSHVMVTEVPYGFIWLNLLVCQAMQALKRQTPGDHELELATSGNYAAWMVRVFARRIRARHDLRDLRKSIAKVLGIDADAWRLCHALQLGSPLDHKATVRQYNLCVQHKAELLDIESCAPGAVGIYAALCRRADFPQNGEPAQRLKGFLRQQGMSSRLWRCVVRDGSRVLSLVRQFYKGRPDDAVLDCLKVINGLGVERMPPDWLTQAIFGEWGNAGARRVGYASQLESFYPNLSHLERLTRMKFTRPDDDQEEVLAEVVHWLTEDRHETLTRTQRQGGWAYLERQSNASHKRREQEVATNGLSWSVPCEVLAFDGGTLVPMQSSSQLLEEGRRMRNCIGDWSARCEPGVEILVSFRDERGKRVATALYGCSGNRWHFIDAKGPMNRLLEAHRMKTLARLATSIPVSNPALAVISASKAIKTREELS